MNLKIACIESGGQRKVARRARIHESTLSRIISGRMLPTKTERERLARALQRPVSDLFPEVAA